MTIPQVFFADSLVIVKDRAHVTNDATFSHDKAKKKSSLKSLASSRSGSSGGTLCGVLLDSVIHAGHIAAIHADRTDCGQCREECPMIRQVVEYFFLENPK